MKRARDLAGRSSGEAERRIQDLADPLLLEPEFSVHLIQREFAVEYQHLETNPAVGKRRRMKVSKGRPVYLDSAEHIAVLLIAAAELDTPVQLVMIRDRRGRTYTRRRGNKTFGRRAAIAILLLAGPRVSAGGALLERDLDFANGRFDVGRDKTYAGM